MVLLASPVALDRSSSVSFGVTAPFLWVLVHAKHFLCVPSRSGVSVFPSLVEVHLIAASLSSLDVGYLSFFLSFWWVLHSPVEVCLADSCDLGALSGEDEHVFFSSIILNQSLNVILNGIDLFTFFFWIFCC